MEHKVCTATRRTKQREPKHTCGTCGKYTEEHFVDDVLQWEEWCNAGCSYEHMRHTVDCDKWVNKYDA